MREELSLLLVILILFVADLFMCTDRKSGRGVLGTPLPVVLLAIHTLLNCVPGEAAEAFGGMYVYTPIMSVMM
mgnify:CR=1 FL=1